VASFAYVQVSRGEVVLHLTTNPGDCSPGSRVRVITWGLLAYHYQLLEKNKPYHPSVLPAPWGASVMALEVVALRQLHRFFCEAPGLCLL
jgi:hypothetical protein